MVYSSVGSLALHDRRMLKNTLSDGAGHYDFDRVERYTYITSLSDGHCILWALTLSDDICQPVRYHSKDLDT